MTSRSMPESPGVREGQRAKWADFQGLLRGIGVLCGRRHNCRACREGHCYSRAVSGGPDQIISVSELDRRLRRAVEDTSVRLWVEGEVSSLKRAPSGHVYFTLKDETEDALIECVMYRFNALRARRHLVEGARLQLTGQATVWAPRGRLQFVGNEARPAGRGALLEALEQLKARLAAEGLFAPERKRALPDEPRVIGVVTSASGAAFHDIRTVAFRRGNVHLVLAPALVQGEGAPESIVRALELLEGYPGLGVVILGRGGGSGEDLMAFNDERVVRCVAGYRVPVVSAVGHEVDFSLTDLAADVRAATPSQAAELVVPDAVARRALLKRAEIALYRACRTRLHRYRAHIERASNRLSDPRFAVAERQQELDEVGARLRDLTLRLLRQRRSGLELSTRRLYSRHPRVVLSDARAELGPLEARLSGAMQLGLSRAAARLSDAAVRLDGLSPLTILARGYAIAHGPDGRALRAADEVAVGDEIRVRLGRGQLVSRVVSRAISEDQPTQTVGPEGQGS